MSNDWVVWLNGKIVPENEALVPIRARGFKYGDGAFDTTRTFGHRIFKLDEHLDRFYRSLNYLQIEPIVSRKTIAKATEEVATHNLKTICANCQRLASVKKLRWKIGDLVADD